MVGFLEPAAFFGLDAPGEAGEGGVDGGGIGLGFDAEVDDFGGGDAGFGWGLCGSFRSGFGWLRWRRWVGEGGAGAREEEGEEKGWFHENDLWGDWLAYKQAEVGDGGK